MLFGTPMFISEANPDISLSAPGPPRWRRAPTVDSTSFRSFLFPAKVLFEWGESESAGNWDTPGNSESEILWDMNPPFDETTEIRRTHEHGQLHEQHGRLFALYAGHVIDSAFHARKFQRARLSWREFSDGNLLGEVKHEDRFFLSERSHFTLKLELLSSSSGFSFQGRKVLHGRPFDIFCWDPKKKGVKLDALLKIQMNEKIVSLEDLTLVSRVLSP